MSAINELKIPRELVHFTDAIRECWINVREDPLYRTVARGSWSIDRIEVMPVKEILSYFKVDRNPHAEVRELPERLMGVRMSCVIGIINNDRTGIEWMPPHVLGRHALFFLDLDSHEVKHTIVGEYVE